MTIHNVTITQRLLVDVDDEDEEVQEYLKTGDGKKVGATYSINVYGMRHLVVIRLV